MLSASLSYCPQEKVDHALPPALTNDPEKGNVGRFWCLKISYAGDDLQFSNFDHAFDGANFQVLQVSHIWSRLPSGSSKLGGR